jgi:hypothetical protein
MFLINRMKFIVNILSRKFFLIILIVLCVISINFFYNKFLNNSKYYSYKSVLNSISYDNLITRIDNNNLSKESIATYQSTIVKDVSN